MKYDLTDLGTIKYLLGEEDFRFSKSKGQNFLKEQWVVERTAEAGCVDPEEGILEVGPGIGCLTAQLASRCRKVVAVEIDETLRPVLAKTLSDFPNVETVFGDIMKMDLHLFLQDHMKDISGVSVCANLPYNITTPVLTKFAECDDIDCVTVMIQKEVADRICAEANTQDWGAFSLFMQWHFETQKLYDVPPECFIPAPKVTSSVIQLRRRISAPAKVSDPSFMFRLVRAAFNQRRKTLANALYNGMGGSVSKEEIARALNTMGVSPSVRGEAFSLQDFANLANLFSCNK